MTSEQVPGINYPLGTRGITLSHDAYQTAEQYILSFSSALEREAQLLATSSGLSEVSKTHIDRTHKKIMGESAKFKNYVLSIGGGFVVAGSVGFFENITANPINTVNVYWYIGLFLAGLFSIIFVWNK